MKHKTFIKQIFSVIVKKIYRFQASNFKFQEVGFKLQASSFKKGGFTILEVIIAISVMTIGLLGTYAFIAHFYEYTSLSEQRLTAAYLASEGVEIVKNIRDSNWLEGAVWNSGISVGSWEADYNTTSSLSDDYDGDYLYFESSGFYGYDTASGTSTVFKREIEVCTSTTGAEGIIYASSTVSWSERGRSHSVKTEEKLFNWYE